MVVIYYWIIYVFGLFFFFKQKESSVRKVKTFQLGWHPFTDPTNKLLNIQIFSFNISKFVFLLLISQKFSINHFSPYF
jgi:hypothetical protein